jgi:Zn-dependent protease with chaperone function
MKVLSKGTGTFEGRPDTLAIRNINLKPFKPKSNFVVRFDPWVLGNVSKTTKELPSNVYYRTKMKKDIREIFDPVTLTVTALTMLSLNLAMIFFMLGVYISASKRNKPLEKKLNAILKDGKQWKVYIIKEKGPNAFCITNPVVFMTTGLKEMLTEDEIIAVLLHEAGHIKNKDIWKNVGFKASFFGIIVAAAWAAPAVIAVQIGIMIALAAAALGIDTTIVGLTFGRKAERRADSTAVKYGYGKPMASALDKIDKWIAKTSAKRPCLKMCKVMTKLSETLDEHPPLKERVKDVLEETETWNPQTFKSISNAKNYFMKKIVKK